MSFVLRWVFTDPYVPETWTTPINPYEMTTIFPEKNIQIAASTATDGQTLLFEGATPPTNWEFTGHILDREHHDELLRWSEKKNRISITDHFGRVIPVYLVHFDAVPQPAPQRPKRWRHSYTMKCIITGKPTSGTVT